MNLTEANELIYGQRVHVFAHMKREYTELSIQWVEYAHEEPKAGTFFGLGYMFNGEFVKTRRNKKKYHNTNSMPAACVILDNGISAHIVDIKQMEKIS